MLEKSALALATCVPYEYNKRNKDFFMYCAEGARQVAMEEQEGIITLTNENGEEVEYQLIDSITYENAEYVVLLPVDEEDCEVVILAVEADDDEMENYVVVDDEEILEGVYAIFKERFADELDFED